MRLGKNVRKPQGGLTYTVGGRCKMRPFRIQIQFYSHVYIYLDTARSFTLYAYSSKDSSV